MRAKFENGWWHCTECGAELPDAAQGRGPAVYQNVRGSTVFCPKCGAMWRFDYYCLNRWPRDRGNTRLEPHLIATGKQTIK